MDDSASARKRGSSLTSSVANAQDDNATSRALNLLTSFSVAKMSCLLAETLWVVSVAIAVNAAVTVPEFWDPLFELFSPVNDFASAQVRLHSPRASNSGSRFVLAPAMASIQLATERVKLSSSVVELQTLENAHPVLTISCGFMLPKFASRVAAAANTLNKSQSDTWPTFTNPHTAFAHSWALHLRPRFVIANAQAVIKLSSGVAAASLVFISLVFRSFKSSSESSATRTHPLLARP
mmetsp:Transcript_12221/g.40615  ORF Transcript_12221/g.40615 Transcript_12221/m.40615 type:complete len:237 (+) Transcript_12221:2573-3283(+)